jgi:hypothetical protein
MAFTYTVDVICQGCGRPAGHPVTYNGARGRAAAGRAAAALAEADGWNLNAYWHGCPDCSKAAAL